MELVYLWVEEYKNIYKQGFNFSPRFECKYENNELIICDKKEKDNKCKNKDYIENFFGKNINVTAIVGKNGSGKSNLLKLLFNNEDTSPVKDRFYIVYYEKIKKLNLYYFDTNELSVVKRIKFNKSYNINKIKEEKSKQDKYDFSIINFSNIFQDFPVHADKHDKKFDDISTSYLIDKYARDNNITSSYRGQYYFKKSKDIEKSLILLRNTSLKLPFDVPKGLNIVLDAVYSSEKIKDIKKLYKSNEKLTFSLTAKRNIVYNFYHNYLEDENKKEFTDKISQFEKNYIEKAYQLVKKEIPLNDEVDNFLKTIKGDKKKDFLISAKIKEIGKEFIDNLKRLNKSVANILNIFHFNWKPDLSTGQETFLFQFSNFYDSLQKNDIQENILILIDEGDLTFHPQWQKKYLNYYIKFFEDNFSGKNFHFIFTSHSSFIISDLPKQNIIFLDKDEKGNCKVVDGLKEKKQTFGANIHTLLSDSFFMEDGLMGEFAKGKIEEVIDYLNDKESKIKDNDEAQKLISIIGEPIIKNQLQKMLESKRLVKINKIDLIEKQIKILQDELKKVQK